MSQVKPKPQSLLKVFLIIIGVLLGIGASKVAVPVLNKKDTITIAAAEKKVEDYLKTSGLTNISIKKVTDKDDWVYNIDLESDGQKFTSYMSKDGKRLFQGAIELDLPQNAPTAPQEVPKESTPKVELFVMSHCPYGTQMEKGILPVLETLGDNIDFELKFCDYAMHGETEINEQLKQYCIQQQGKNKIVTYLKCFLKEENAQGCLQEASVNATELNTCVAQTDDKYKITANLADESTWVNGRFPPFDIYKAETTSYGVQGSPTLVLNGQPIQPAGRDPKNLLATICTGFNTTPAECNTELSSASPTPGFGFETTDTATDASCN